MSSISVSSLVLGSLTVEVEGTDSSLALSVLATAPAVLSVELGTPGAQGPAATIAVGTTTTLSPGAAATVVNAGTTSAAVFNFGIPSGLTGATGATGATGTAATIAVGSTSTGAAGSSASVANSGTSSAAVFDFTIPRGDVGATGATGATGPVGPGVATGGTTGQVLSKASGTNYDTTWSTIVPGDRYLTTSTTSLTINNGNKTLTVGTGLSYTPTQNVTISYDASNHMHGEVLTYNSGTGVMTVDVNHHTGSGTYTAWVVNVGGVTPATSTAWGSITGTLSSQVDLQTALDLKSNLASPTFTGTPTLPTGTIATTQSPGNNTTALATTAFVTAAVPAFATVTDVINNPTSTTTSVNPFTLVNGLCNPNVRSLVIMTATAVSGSGASGGSSAAASGIREMYTNAVSSAGRSGFYFGKTDVTPGYNNSNWRLINWSKKVIVSGRSMMGSTDYSTNYNGDANTTCRIFLGGRAATYTTGSITQKGISLFKVGGNSSAVQLQVHNGTSAATVASSFTPATGEAFSWTLYSDGAGNVTLYINGSSVATSSAGPTGNSTAYYTMYGEQVEATASAAVRQILYCFGGQLYIET